VEWKDVTELTINLAIDDTNPDSPEVCVRGGLGDDPITILRPHNDDLYLCNNTNGELVESRGDDGQVTSVSAFTVNGAVLKGNDFGRAIFMWMANKLSRGVPIVNFAVMMEADGSGGVEVTVDGTMHSVSIQDFVKQLYP